MDVLRIMFLKALFQSLKPPILLFEELLQSLKALILSFEAVILFLKALILFFEALFHIRNTPFDYRQERIQRNTFNSS